MTAPVLIKGHFQKTDTTDFLIVTFWYPFFTNLFYGFTGLCTDLSIVSGADIEYTEKKYF